MKINKNIVFSIFFFILFLFILIFVVTGNSRWFDSFIYQALHSFRSDVLDQYFIFITKLANTMVIVIVVLLFLCIMRNRYGLYLLASAVDGVIITTLVKVLVRRIRPDELRLITQGGYSFPSGHSMMSMCVYGYLLYLVITKLKNRYLKILVSIILILVILSIGVSRIYVGVHYASDVVSGYCLGLAYLFFLIYVINKVNVHGG